MLIHDGQLVGTFALAGYRACDEIRDVRPVASNDKRDPRRRPADCGGELLLEPEQIRIHEREWELTRRDRRAIVCATFGSPQLTPRMLAALPRNQREAIESLPSLNAVRCKTLLDTGANNSLITPDLADDLGLDLSPGSPEPKEPDVPSEFYDDQGQLQVRQETTYIVGATVFDEIPRFPFDVICRPVPPSVTEAGIRAILGTIFLNLYQFEWNKPWGKFTLRGPYLTPPGN